MQNVRVHIDSGKCFFLGLIFTFGVVKLAIFEGYDHFSGFEVPMGQLDNLMINDKKSDFCQTCQFLMLCNSGAGTPFSLFKVNFGIYRSRSRCWTHSKYSPMMTNDRKMLALESYKTYKTDLLASVSLSSF